MSPSPPPGSIPWELFEELLALHPSLACGVCFVRLAQRRHMMHTLRTNVHPHKRMGICTGDQGLHLLVQHKL
jgi:hypothetical protein